MVRMNVVTRREEVLVAICDSDIVGKVFREGKARLEVAEDFYGEKEVNIDLAIETLATATIGNLVGEQIIEAAIKAGLVDKDNIIRIGGVPHAQLCTMG